MLGEAHGVRRGEENQSDLDRDVFGECIPNDCAHDLRGFVLGIAVCTGRNRWKCDRAEIVLYGDPHGVAVAVGDARHGPRVDDDGWVRLPEGGRNARSVRQIDWGQVRTAELTRAGAAPRDDVDSLASHFAQQISTQLTARAGD